MKIDINELKKTIYQKDWYTLGRKEIQDEYFKKCLSLMGRIEYFKKKISFEFILDQDSQPHSESDYLETLESIQNQIYPYYTVTSVHRDWTTHLKNLSNDSSKTADYSIRMYPGDTWYPQALFEIALLIEKENDIDFIYTFEIDNSNFSVPQFLMKNEFCSFTLSSFDFLGNAIAFKKDKDPKQILSSSENKIKLIPQYLFGTKQPRLKNSIKHNPYSNPIFKKEDPKTISVIVCFKDHADWTTRCIQSLMALKYQASVQLILVNNNSTENEWNLVQKNLSEYQNIVWVHCEKPFNFAYMHEMAVSQYATGEILFLLNNDVFLSPNVDLDLWAEQASQKNVGTVGILLKRPDQSVQHSGMRAWFGGLARTARVGNSSDSDLWALSPRSVYGNTFAACLFKKSLFFELGGLRTLDMPNGFGDVAFNLECLKKNLNNIFLGQFLGIHLESASRGNEYEYWEECLVESENAAILQKMVRKDFAVNRLPGDDLKLSSFLKSYFMIQFREKTRFLNFLKPAIKKIWNQISKYRKPN